MRRVLVVALLAAGLVVVASPPASADAPFVVTTTNDVVNAGDGLLSLREAVIQARDTAGADTIQLAPSATYVLDECVGPPGNEAADALSGSLDHVASGDLTIQGNGSIISQSRTPSSACGQTRIIGISGGTLTLVDLTLTNGNTVNPCPLTGSEGCPLPNGEGGAVRAQGELVLDHVVVTGNQATREEGGGVWSATRITAIDSTFTDNSAQSGGAIASLNEVVIDRSTVSGNEARAPHNVAAATSVGRGGGVYVEGDATITNSTITQNVVPVPSPITAGGTTFRVDPGYGGGVWAGGGLVLEYATVTANRARYGSNLFVQDQEFRSFGSAIGGGIPGVPNCRLRGTVVSEGYNAVKGGKCRLTDPTDVTGLPSLGLAALAANGGPTQTRLPVNSTVSIIPNGLCTEPSNDQRGEARPIGTMCEAGAVEIF